jgi:shikimate kinase
MVIVEAIVHGAVSIVSAIATGNGATLGIDTFVKTKLEVKDGTGIHITSDNKTISSRLINKVIENVIPKRQLEKVRLELNFQSNIPTGYGLKSSSAISTAVSLVCSKAIKKKLTDEEILKIGVESSLQTKVSITGAYDDACACYYGGFNVTNNYKRDLIFRGNAPSDLQAIIFLPKSRKRGNVKKLKNFKPAFEKAWELAKNHDYWNASILNGLATSSILNSNPELLFKLMKKGAISATISGNGPSIVAITKKGHNSNIKKELSSLEGKVIVSNINNKKAESYEV